MHQPILAFHDLSCQFPVPYFLEKLKLDKQTLIGKNIILKHHLIVKLWIMHKMNIWKIIGVV